MLTLSQSRKPSTSGKSGTRTDGIEVGMVLFNLYGPEVCYPIQQRDKTLTTLREMISPYPLLTLLISVAWASLSPRSVTAIPSSLMTALTVIDWVFSESSFLRSLSTRRTLERERG